MAGRKSTATIENAPDALGKEERITMVGNLLQQAQRSLFECDLLMTANGHKEDDTHPQGGGTYKEVKKRQQASIQRVQTEYPEFVDEIRKRVAPPKDDEEESVPGD